MGRELGGKWPWGAVPGAPVAVVEHQPQRWSPLRAGMARHCPWRVRQTDASVLQEGGQSANMYIRPGAIWEILAKYPFTHEMKTLLAGLILIHSWYPNECCADKDCHPVPCDEISEGENGAMHWKNLIFEGSQIRTSPDSECHVCHLSEEGRPVIPICIFTQKKPSA